MMTRALVGAAAAFFLALPAHAQTTGWQPTRNVEIVAASAAGGAQDRTARAMQKLMAESRIVATPVTIMNKPGGGGNIAVAYLNQHAADGHYISVGSPTLLATAIMKRSAESADITPLAILFSEYIVLAVRTESPITNGRDLVQRLKAQPDSVSFAVASARGGMQHVGVGLVARGAGADVKKLKVAVFNSGGDSVTAVLGGHVDVVATAAANAAAQVEAGRMRVIGVAAPERLPAIFAKAPTWKEQGVNAVASNWRSVIGPRGLTPAQVAYWDAALTRLTAAPEWQEDMRKNHWTGTHLRSKEAAAYMEAQSQELKGILGELLLAQ